MLNRAYYVVDDSIEFICVNPILDLSVNLV